MWSHWLVATQSGDRIVQLDPSDYDWNRVLNTGGQGGRHTLQLSEFVRGTPDYIDWDALLVEWATTIVVSWVNETTGAETAVYAGCVEELPYSFTDQVLEVSHVDIRSMLAARHPFGVESYWDDEGRHIPGDLNLTARSWRGIAANIVAQSLIGPHPSYSLPIDLPANEVGPIDFIRYNYQFPNTAALLEEVQAADGGPDIDFKPYWSGSKLRWQMRCGSPTTPRLDGVKQFEFHVNVEEPSILDLRRQRSGAKILTGMFTIGEGGSDKMRVGGRGLGNVGLPYRPIPARDGVQYAKDEADEEKLAGQSAAVVKVLQYPTRQYSANVLATDLGDDVALLLPGSTIRLHIQDDPTEPNGWKTLRLLDYSGGSDDLIRFQFQPLEGAA